MPAKILLLVMASSANQRSEIGRRLALSTNLLHLDLTPLDDERTPELLEALQAQIQAEELDVVMTTRLLSALELRKLQGEATRTVWIRAAHETEPPPAPNTLVVDGSMSVGSIVATIQAVFKLSQTLGD
jgi:hypothetical protein